MFRNFLLWLPMPLLAILNAAIREVIFLKFMDDKPANQISTLTLMILLGVYVWIIFGKIKIENSRSAVNIGLLWVLLTILFETGLSLLNGSSTHEIFQAYNIFKGEFWILIPLSILTLPLIVFKIKN